MNRASVTLFLPLLIFIASCKTDPPLLGTHHCNTAAPANDTLVLLVMGQSNAANAGETLYASHCENAFNFYSGKLYPLADPLQGANGDGGSVWSRLADKIIEQNKARVVIVAPCAVGGTRIEQWIPGGDLNHLITETIDHLNASGLTVTHVLWHQGESNHVAYSGGLTPQQNAESYTLKFNLLVDFLRQKGITTPIYPAVATRCVGLPDATLALAQENLADPARGIFNGPNTDLLGNEFRYDNCHFNKAGLDMHAELWLQSVWE